MGLLIIYRNAPNQREVGISSTFTFWLQGGNDAVGIKVISKMDEVGAWWLIGRFGAFRPKGRGFQSRSRRHGGTLNKVPTWRPSLGVACCASALNFNTVSMQRRK